MADESTAPTAAELVHQHYELVYRVAYRLSGSAADAEDLTQQVFLSACRASEQVRNPAAVRSWLLTILRNAFTRFRTRSQGRPWLSLENQAEPAVAALEQSEVDPEELQAALNELPAEFREPVILFYFESLSYREIAERLDAPIGTVMSRLSRAKSFLRKRLASAHPAST
ncbi:MAG: sigma-70 family RNA polymerase sigma factor [Planctomyces sp.]|nr:sigma-70 family RNA polymerase sigma factor [Planctomyces sp.]